MPIQRIESAIQREHHSIDLTYKVMDEKRALTNALGTGIILGAGYLGTKSITKNENSALKEALSGAADFVAKHLNNGIKNIDKKEKLTKVTDFLQKVKEMPARTKALALFGGFIFAQLIGLAKVNGYMKGILNQAKADEKTVAEDRIIRNNI